MTVMSETTEFSVERRIVNALAGALLELFAESFARNARLRIEYVDEYFAILRVQYGLAAGPIAARYVIVDALEFANDPVHGGERHARQLAQLAHAPLATRIQLDHFVFFEHLFVLLHFECGYRILLMLMLM